MRTQLRARRADKTVGVIHQIEHRRNNERACDDTNDQRDLLLPRRRIDQLTGLEILKVIVGNRCHVENYRGGEKRERDQRFARVRDRRTV